MDNAASIQDFPGEADAMESDPERFESQSRRFVGARRFIADLEAEAARRGMNQVRANRVITVRTEQERLAAPLDANSNGITEGQSNGWRLIYCKGCEGEQLEFVQALGPVKIVFDNAREARQKAVDG